ncbi:MAG: Integrase [uncultured Thermomicrobiales bacterium]|uniref:Integrase n=1 Tax=uncultured Thermomicrobiales bacterium TaxID=1645740 RepID=A0A6J4U9P1_9BACT|nr:MAG: Integrase [uncultured Thermomicrobiales bacterium]
MATKRRGRHEGTIKHRADGRWEAQITLPHNQRKSIYARTRKEAQEKLKAAIRDLDSGVDFAAGSMTVAAFLQQWLDAAVRPSVKPKTWEGYESIVRVRIAPRIGRRQIAKLSPLDVQGLYAALEVSGLTARSVHHTHRCLHRALDQAVRWGMIPRNPCDGAVSPRAKKAEMRVLSQEQAIAFLDANRDQPAYALYTLAITTGMRQGELLGLRWADIGLDRGRLEVRRSLQRQKEAGLVFVEPKSARGRRPLVLGAIAVAALRAHQDRQAFVRLAAGREWRGLDLVFCTGNGGPLDPGWVRETFYAAVKRAGLAPIRFPDLRHTAATLALRQGVHPKVVSEMLGHASITLTLDTYSHLVPVLHEEAAAAMDRALGA